MNQYSLLIALVFTLVIFHTTSAEVPTRTVAINVADLSRNTEKIYFICPDVRELTDIVEIYRIKGSERLKITTDINGYGSLLIINNVADIGAYECVVVSGTSKRTAVLNIVDHNKEKSPERFVYKPENLQQKIVKEGDSVDLECPGVTGSVVWYKPQGFLISKEKTLKIQKVTKFDYGSYYCTGDDIKQIELKGSKINLVPNDQVPLEKAIDSEEAHLFKMERKTAAVRFRPTQLTNRIETVTWEKPPGTVLFNQGRDLYYNSYDTKEETESFYYRVHKNGNPMINKVGRVVIPKVVDKDIKISFVGTPKFGEEIKIDCVPGGRFINNSKVVWKFEDKVVHEGNTLTIKKLDADSIGKYKCEISKAEGQTYGSSIDFKSTKKEKGKIEMSEEPGSFNIFHRAGKVELHCEIERSQGKWETKSKDIKWTFNGEIIDVGNKRSSFGNTQRFHRMDRLSASILILAEMDKDNEGSYKCFKGSAVLASNLVMEPELVNLELAPEMQTVMHNKYQEAEFHCRITSRGLNSSHIKWFFIPLNSGDGSELPLPKEAKVTRPEIAETTSFVSINNVLKKHEGKYVCKVGSISAIGTLVVIQKAVLTISPEIVTVKPGGEARFLCTLSNIDGTVVWRRKDKKSLTVNKENRLGGSTQSILEVKQVTLADDGTEYECFYKNQVKTAILYVKDDCPLSQRKCKSGKCIDEGKFCDGNDDCGDNSDEDKTKCNECSPNSIHCDFLNGSDPTRRCVIKHWKCDGINDCGNNFDELNCPIKNKDKCIGSHYLCDNSSLIPRSYWCDGENDCPSGDDEQACSDPQVITPTKQTKFSIVKDNKLVLKCVVSGRPVATVTWRFNWGYLNSESNFSITEQVDNCSLITSTLTVENVRPEDSGVYTCEAIAKRRVMSPDYLVTVAQENICKQPYFSNDALDKKLCIKCYCSNFTDDCKSAVGYTKADQPIRTEVKSSDAVIVNAANITYFPLANTVNFIDKVKKTYYIDPKQYINLVPDDSYYFGGAFNMRESWLLKYGYPMTFYIVASGNDSGILKGPLLALVDSKNQAIYYCPPPYKLWVHPSNDNFKNQLQVTFWEKDFWFQSYSCEDKVSRDRFLDSLINFKMLLVRVKYFEGQTDFRMSSLAFETAEPTNTDLSWANNIEKCNCPTGRKGLSCEMAA